MSSTYSQPKIWRQTTVFFGLLAIITFGALQTIQGDNGANSLKKLRAEKILLSEELDKITAQQQRYQHLLSLYKPHQLDPDIIEEQARNLLMMANKNDIIVPE